MMEQERIVRNDRVGLYKLGLLSNVPLPLISPSYGDMWLDSSGRLGVNMVKRYNAALAMSLAEVSEAREATLLEAIHCYQGAAPSRMIHVNLAGTRYLVLFLGITHFLSRGENVIAKVPGVHHAGAFAVGVKSAIDNRGAKGRALAARRIWLSVLKGEVRPSDLVAL
jgi:hypothetical protein